MKCPTCNINLVMSDRQGVEIDYCPECRGVWLDRGELDKIIEKSSSMIAPIENRSDRHYSEHDKTEYRKDDYHKDDYHKKRKKESWIGEIFDF